jgi:hypothetical protein
MTATLPAMPTRIARLPRNQAGYPVPWFVAWIDGKPDFRVIGIDKMRDALQFRQCWICGDTLGANVSFVIGPMCAVNRVSAEPPSHHDCAVFAATACPFLANPQMRRRDSNLPEDTVDPDGIAISRNPGVALVWTTRTWSLIPAHQLFNVGDPTRTEWYARGRAATRGEVLESIASGLPLLEQAAEQDHRPAKALAQLASACRDALQYVPAATP